MRWALLLLMLCPIAPVWAQQPAPVSIGELEADTSRNPDDPKPWVLLGLAYWNGNDYPRALEAFQRAVKVGPESAEAHNWLGVALSERADLPGAIAALRKAVELDPQYGRAYTNLGSALAQSGDFGEAVQIFQKALALEPNSLGAQMNLGVALRESGDLEGALQHLGRVAAVDPKSGGIQYELGQTLRQSGDLAGAIAAFEKAIEIEPELREGYYGLGTALKQQSSAIRKSRPSVTSPADDPYRRAQDAVARGELDAAREQLTEALRLDERHAEAHTLLGFTLGQQGDLPAALTHLERAITLQPESSDAHYNLGVALWYGGSDPSIHLSGSSPLSRTATIRAQTGSSSAELAPMAPRTEVNSGLRDRAVTELQQSVTLDPAAGVSHAFLGTVLRDRGDWAGARASLQRAIALMPPTAAIYVDLGITYLRAGELDKALGQLQAGLNLPSPSQPTPDWGSAIASLRQALAANPNRAEAHNTLGLLLGRAGTNSNDVANQFRDAIKLEPDFAEAHNNLGLVLIQAGDDEAGIAALREAVRISPDYAEARANLGAALTPTDAAEAIRELEKAAALAPSSVNALYNLAVAYGSSPDHGPAKEIQQLRKVLELAPTFARAHLGLGKALLQDGKVTDAIGELEEAARLEPKSGEAHYQLGLALARAGRREEAAVALQKGRELVAADDRSQNANRDLADGRAALQRGELEEAVAKFRRAIQLQPESFEAQQSLGTVLEKQGDTDGATRAYQNAVELNPIAVSAKQSLERLLNTEAGRDDPQKMAALEGYIREERFQEAEPLATQYVNERPRSSWGWYTLGYTQFAQQKIGDSIRALAKSLELDIRNAEAHKILGRSLMIIGRFDAAQIEFEQALRYKPNSAEAHYNLGKLFSIQDNWEPARKAFEAALRIDPSYLEALDALGFALEALGDDTGAIEKYEQAIALNGARHGAFASPLVNLSAYYNRTGEPEKAIDYARKALALDPQSDRALFQKGRAEERLGNLDEAVNALNEAIAINPRASSYCYVLAGVYRRLGWMDESRKALEMFSRLERESRELEQKRRARE